MLNAQLFVMITTGKLLSFSNNLFALYTLYVCLHCLPVDRNHLSWIETIGNSDSATYATDCVAAYHTIWRAEEEPNPIIYLPKY